MTQKMLNLMKADHQQTFEVGEYYASKTGIVFKITSKTTKEEIAAVKSLVDGEIIDGMIDTTEIMFRYSKPATAEQIATFKRAEHFADHGREWSEFKKGDIVQNTETMQLGLVESVDEDGDALVNYNIDKPLIYPSCCKCTGALFLNLVQTAEELREAEKDG